MQDLTELGRVPNSNSECPLLMLETNRQRSTAMELVAEVCTDDDEIRDGGKDLEDMMDEERIPVVVCIYKYM